MKKTALIWIIILGFNTIYAQNKIAELEICYSSSKTSKKESFAIPNQMEDALMVLFEEKKLFNAKLLNKDYEEESNVIAKTLPSKYQSMIGYNIEDNVYSLFFSKNNYKKIAVQSFDFTSKTSTITELDFKLKKEKYVESITYKNKLHLISITKNSNDINIYTFNKDYSFQKKTVSFPSLQLPLPSTYYYSSTMYAALTNSFSLSSFVDLTKIENQNPNVIETTSDLIKLYQIDNTIIFSFDINNKLTQLYEINLDTYKIDVKEYDKPEKTEPGFYKSNSYIFDNKLFQIASSSAKMKFKIIDLQSKKLIKEYGVTKEDSITFKNSPIIQEGGGMFPGLNGDRVREMEKTSKYLRKISNADLGISVYKTGDDYNIILGGTKEIVSGGAPMMMPGFGNMGSVPIASIGNSIQVGFNPTFMGYTNYSTTKSTYINCLFDQNFEHLPGEINNNQFDDLYDYEDGLEQPEAVNVFIHKNLLHYAYFDIETQTYKLVTFD